MTMAAQPTALCHACMPWSTTPKKRASMKDLAPEYMARKGEGLREAADARFTMTPFLRAAMPGSTTRVM